jgi:hypothetical protein
MKKWWVEEFFFWLEPLDNRKWSKRDLLWVPVETPGLAKWARGPALIFAGFAAVLWTIAVILGFFTPSINRHWTLIYALLWVLVTWGLLKMRPEAAIGGFVLSLIGLIQGIIGREYDIIAISMTWVSVHAIRGTFAFQRFTKLENGAASGQQKQ